MRHFRKLILIGVLLLYCGTGAGPSYGQSALSDVRMLTQVIGLNTVPDHGDEAVSFLDYRNGSYRILAVDLSSGLEEDLERVFYAEPEVRTSGKRVAWIGYTPVGQPDIYFHDRATGVTMRVTSDQAIQNHPDLSDEFLVWQDYRNAGSDGLNADIYVYDFSSGATVPVTTDPGYQDLPRIHGNWIVWQDYRHAGPLLDTAEIYAFDLTTQTELRLTTGSAFRTHPAVWNHRVVWEDYRGGVTGDIYLYDLEAQLEIPIATHAAHQSHPSVFGEWVLWLDYRNSAEQGDLYGYHLSTGQEHALVVHPAHQEAPHVYGNSVVWQDYRDGRFDLWTGRLVEPVTISREPDALGQGLRVSVAPNPFSHTATFSVVGASSVSLDLTIFDLLGRPVVQKSLPAGTTEWRWDGRSDSGVPAGPGAYIGVVTGQAIFQRVVFVRQP